MSRVRNPQGGPLLVDQLGTNRDFIGETQVELAYVERYTDAIGTAGQTIGVLGTPWIGIGRSLYQLIQVDMYTPQIIITGGGTTEFHLYARPLTSTAPWTLLRKHRVDQSTTLNQPILCSNIFWMPYASYPTASFQFEWDVAFLTSSAGTIKAGNGSGSNMAPSFLRVTALGTSP